MDRMSGRKIGWCMIVVMLVSLSVSPVFAGERRDLVVGGEGPNRYPTIQAAIAAAGPGDTVHLDPAHGPYRQSAVFSNKFGEPGRPITLDGHGALLLGSEPLDPDKWEDQGDGLWRSESLAKRLRMPRAMASRFFFIFDGQPQYMGGASKLRSPQSKPAQELEAGEWSFDAQASAFFVRIAPGQTLAEARIEVPERSGGVLLRNENRHLVIRNIKVKHVWNDGFNIHGHSEDVLFENIEAIECGDDGISAHSACQITVDGMISRGNANGICHVDQTRTVHRRILIQESRSYDLYLLNDSHHTFEDMVIEAAAPRGVVIVRGTQVAFDRVQLHHPAAAIPLRVDGGAQLTVQASTLWNVQAQIKEAAVSLHRSAIGGEQATWSLDRPRSWVSDHNRWAVREWRSDGHRFAADELAGFQAATGQDAASTVWDKADQKPDAAGWLRGVVE